MKFFPFLFLLVVACGADTQNTEDLPPDAENDGFVSENTGKDDAFLIKELSYEAICVLSFVNQSSEEELFDVVHKIPAKRIWEKKIGEDGKLGSADDHYFETVEDLDNVSFVGFFTFRALEKHALANGYCPTLGQETLVPGEDEISRQIGERSEQFVRERFDEDMTARRDAHAKSHGCVKAFVDVDNSALREDEKIGVFAENREFPAWIRFSNGNPAIQNDEEKDARGFALKLMEVPGEKVLEKQKGEKTQDFLLINGQSFFVRTPSDYLEFSTKAFDGNPITFFLSLNPLKFKFRELKNLLSIALAKPSSPITQYWSTTPYALGSGRAVKYSVRPCGDFESGWPKDRDDNFLGQTLVDQLASEDQCFEFLLQRQIDPISTPIEDATIEWETVESPYVKVAQIRIPKQSFSSDEQMEFCENLSFNPWHTLPAHRPLGNINRTRRIVYDMISNLRHTLNQRTEVEPEGHINFN